MCRCQESLAIKHTKYHDENYNPTLSLVYVVYCDHMGSAEQHLWDIPLELTLEEYDKLSLQEKVGMLRNILLPSMYSDDVIKKLVEDGKVILKEYDCPYCS